MICVAMLASVLFALFLVAGTIVTAKSFEITSSNEINELPQFRSSTGQPPLISEMPGLTLPDREQPPQDESPGNWNRERVSDDPVSEKPGRPPVWDRENPNDLNSLFPVEDDAANKPPSGAAVILEQSKNALSPSAPDYSNGIYLHMPYSVVEGHTEPDRNLHMFLTRGGAQTGEARFHSDQSGYFWADLMEDGWYADIQAGDVLTVETESSSPMTLSVPNITATVFPITDTIIGQLTGVSLPADLRIDSQGNIFNQTTDASGNFTVTMSSILDVFWDTWIQVGYEENENWVFSYFHPQDGMVVRQTYPAVRGYTQPEITVTVDVNHGGSIYSHEVESQWSDGFWQADFSEIDEIAPGDIVTAWVNGVTNTVVLSHLEASFDLANDRITGNAPSYTDVTVYYSERSGHTSLSVFDWETTDGSGVFTATFSTGSLDAIKRGYVVMRENMTVDHWIAPRQLLGQVDWPYNSAFGYAHASEVVTVTLQDGSSTTLEQHTRTARSNDGYFVVYFEEAFVTGYKMVFEGGGLNVTVDLVDLTVDQDLDENTVFGDAPADEVVWVQSQGGVFGPYYADYVVADGTGDYILDLEGVQDLYNGGWAEAYHPQGDDVDQAGWQDAAVFDPFIGLNSRHNGVWGIVPAANTPVTFTLNKGGDLYYSYATSNSMGEFDWTQFEDGAVDIEPGDEVTVAIDGWSQAVTAVSIDFSVDAFTDQVTGIGPADSFVEVRVQGGYPSLRVPTDGSGNFIADFSRIVDITGGFEVQAGIYDENWNFPHYVATVPYARANMTWNAVDGWFGVGVSVDFTVSDSEGNVKGGGSGPTNDDGWMDGIWCGQYDENCDMLPGDLVTVTSDAGFFTVMEMITVTGAIDLDADQIAGQMVGGDFPANGEYGVWSPGRRAGPWDSFAIDPDGSYLIDLSDFGLQMGDQSELYYIDPDGNRVGVEIYTMLLFVNYRYDWVQAQTVPESSVAVTIEGKANLQGDSWPDGYFDTDAWYDNWDPEPPDIEPGDVLIGSAAGYNGAIDPIGEIDGVYDLNADVFTGTLDAPWFSEGLRVRCRDDEHDVTFVFPSVDPDGGQFVCDFGAEGVDLKSGHIIRLDYFDPNGNRVTNVIEVPFARANTAWDAVDGWFGPGVTLVYTVTDALGALKGGATKSARPDGWVEGEWCGQLTGDCDMLPGDLVTVTSDNGFFAVLELITVTGRIDIDTDEIYGDMEDGVFPAEGEYWISHRDGSGDHGERFTTDGDGGYAIDMTGVFDARLGDQAEVWYIDPNGNYVGNNFWTLELQVNYGHDWVQVRTNPHSDVEINVEGKATIAGTSGGGGWFRTHEHNGDWDPNQPDIAPGDVVTATADGYTAAVNPLGSIEGTVDAVMDTVQGNLNAPFDDPLTVICEVWVENGPDSIEVSGVDPDGGSYSCDFGGIWDILPGQDIALIYREPDGDEVINVLAVPYARANTSWNAVDGWFGVDVNVVFTVTDGLGNPKGGGSGTAGSDGWLNGVNCGCDLLVGDLVTVTSDAGFNALLQPITITAHLDEDAEQVTGHMEGGTHPSDGYGEDWNHGRQSGSNTYFEVDASGNYTADFSPFDLLQGDWINIWYCDPNGNRLGFEFTGLRMEAVISNENAVYVETEPNALVTINVDSGAEYVGQANGEGDLWTWDNELWTPFHPDIQTGDTVTVTAAGHTALVNPVGTITGALNLDANTINGMITAPGWPGEVLQVACNIWEPGAPGINVAASADGGGYSCDFDDVGWDLNYEDDVAVYYFEPDGDAVVSTFILHGIYLPVIRR
jgi:hypothetical protein